ncbi:iron chelate uptake ABC transporter family permease subunit [Romboutsia sp.]|uniref:iron chelate uptake ABC transporter family permease subunit n=1 Tax=Romboutsia sp. TaxID=1965302 RepID=UPI002CBE0D56|nr:iron chelate uptake ABC transporter family permease subunit [Romboutsia sp.]HSQ90450.1 iron chelate uptake ABC transporter family permease subunit [Romboutsia sp.]
MFHQKGIFYLVWTDVLARTIVAPSDLPIGIITALFGAPFFIWLVKKNNYSFGE